MVGTEVLRYGLTGGGGDRPGLGCERRTTQPICVQPTGRGAPEKCELTQTRRYHRTSFACDWALTPSSNLRRRRPLPRRSRYGSGLFYTVLAILAFSISLS